MRVHSLLNGTRSKKFCGDVETISKKAILYKLLSKYPNYPNGNSQEILIRLQKTNNSDLTKKEREEMLLYFDRFWLNSLNA